MDAANESLVEVTFAGPEVDLETIFRAQYVRIARVIAGVTRDPARAEELAVEVFLKWERSRKAHGEGAEAWLFRTAVRIAFNELRRRAMMSRYERFLQLVTARNTAPAPDDLYATSEERRRVRTVLEAIAPRQAELLLLRCNDFSYQELASALNLNPASVGTLLSRALQAFRKEFIQRYGKDRYGRE